MTSATLRIVDTNACSHISPEQIADYWEENTLIRCLPPMMRDIRAWLDQGFETDVILMAIDQTAVAPRPAWRYLQSIMARSRADGAFTGTAFVMRKRHKTPELPY